MPDHSLFSSSQDQSGEPLAARMRPRTLDDFVGQEHILGEGRLLRRAIQADMISSLILYGPPGTGKTTLARVIANTTKSRFVSLNAVLSGVKDVREAIAEARDQREMYGRRTILFVDEVHRWNKAQQDALLPWVENGTVILIGATTENPFFEVNSALVSRSRLFQLQALESDDLREIARRTLTDKTNGYGRYQVELDDDALDHLVRVADGDARGLLGALQLAVETTPDSFPPQEETRIHITRSIAEDSIQQKAVLYDKEGDYHFDVISAFIKSIRGSDPDATLYWLARMIEAGESPRYVFRRMLVSASEDIGLADPAALGIVEAAASAFDRVGMPEGAFHLTHAALYLATAPKSNSTLAYFDAVTAVSEEAREDVPNHLRDSNRDKEGFGHGEGYLYPHAYRDHWVAQAYLPSVLKGRVFYQPSSQGYEARIAREVAERRELQLEAAIGDPPEEILSYSASADRRLESWVRRSAEQRQESARALRDRVQSELGIARSDRVLVAGRTATLHLWETVRAAPEGRVVGMVPPGPLFESASHYAQTLESLERPLILAASDTLEHDDLPTHAFEHLLLADHLSTPTDQDRSLKQIEESSVLSGATLTMAQRVPVRSMRLSELAAGAGLPNDSIDQLTRAEEQLIAAQSIPRLAWDEETLREKLVDRGWQVITEELVSRDETRYLEARHLTSWLAPEREGIGAEFVKESSEQTLHELTQRLQERLADRTVSWRTVDLVVSARKTSAG